MSYCAACGTSQHVENNKHSQDFCDVCIRGFELIDPEWLREAIKLT